MAPFNHQHGKNHGRLQLVQVQRPAPWRRILRALELEPEDLLAIPVSLVLGLTFAVYSLGSNGMVLSLMGHPVNQNGHGTLSAVVSLLSVPAAAVRQWLS